MYKNVKSVRWLRRMSTFRPIENEFWFAGKSSFAFEFNVRQKWSANKWREESWKNGEHPCSASVCYSQRPSSTKSTNVSAASVPRTKLNMVTDWLMLVTSLVLSHKRSIWNGQTYNCISHLIITKHLLSTNGYSNIEFRANNSIEISTESIGSGRTCCHRKSCTFVSQYLHSLSDFQSAHLTNNIFSLASIRLLSACCYVAHKRSVTSSSVLSKHGNCHPRNWQMFIVRSQEIWC